MPEQLGGLYVWNNSPAFMLYVVNDGKRIFADKILVGTIGYATPVFTADMKTIVFNPDWIAPPTVGRSDSHQGRRLPRRIDSSNFRANSKTSGRNQTARTCLKNSAPTSKTTSSTAARMTSQYWSVYSFRRSSSASIRCVMSEPFVSTT